MSFMNMCMEARQLVARYGVKASLKEEQCFKRQNKHVVKNKKPNFFKIFSFYSFSYAIETQNQ